MTNLNKMKNSILKFFSKAFLLSFLFQSILPAYTQSKSGFFKVFNRYSELKNYLDQNEFESYTRTAKKYMDNSPQFEIEKLPPMQLQGDTLYLIFNDKKLKFSIHDLKNRKLNIGGQIVYIPNNDLKSAYEAILMLQNDFVFEKHQQSDFLSFLYQKTVPSAHAGALGWIIAAAVVAVIAVAAFGKNNDRRSASEDRKYRRRYYSEMRAERESAAASPSSV